MSSTSTSRVSPRSRAAAAAALDELRERYRKAVPRTLDALTRAADQLDIAPDSQDALTPLRRELHRIHGSAGSYGFPEASAIAAVLEKIVLQWMIEPAQRDARRGALVRHAAARLATAFAPTGVQGREGGASAGVTDATTSGSRAADPKPAQAAAREHPSPDLSPVPDVVIVEDDNVLAEMLQFAVRSAGLNSRTYHAGPEALDALLALPRAPRRTLILLDVDLPGLDGHSMHERLREQRPSVYDVVFISAHGSEADQIRALRAGAIDYIVKPLSLPVLVAKLPALLARARAAA